MAIAFAKFPPTMGKSQISDFGSQSCDAQNRGDYNTERRNLRDANGADAGSVGFTRLAEQDNLSDADL